MTKVRYNPETLDYDLIDSRTLAVLESGYNDLQAATEVAHFYDMDEE